MFVYMYVHVPYVLYFPHDELVVVICLVEDDNSLEDEISTKRLLEWSLLLQLMLRASYVSCLQDLLQALDGVDILSGE